MTIKPANSDFQTTQILSDCGSQFNSHKWLDFCKHNNIKKANTSIYQPQGDGITERQRQSLLTKLRILNKGKKDWTPTLVQATEAVNNSFSTVTGERPAAMLSALTTIKDQTERKEIIEGLKS
jgi:transposase InsO family protein